MSGVLCPNQLSLLKESLPSSKRCLPGCPGWQCSRWQTAKPVSRVPLDTFMGMYFLSLCTPVARIQSRDSIWMQGGLGTAHCLGSYHPATAPHGGSWPGLPQILCHLQNAFTCVMSFASHHNLCYYQHSPSFYKGTDRHSFRTVRVV